MKCTADHLFATLRSYGVDHIFGIPGDELKLFDALSHSGIQFITTRHEQAAAFMAQAVGKLSSLPGVCISTLGPGATNLVTSVADAFQNRAPLIALSGQLDTASQSVNPLAHQYIDLQKLFAPITKATFVVKDPDDVQDVLREAMRVASSPRPGPVHVSLPQDVMERAAHRKKIPAGSRAREAHRAIDPKAVSRAARLIRSANKPILFLGLQARDTDRKLLEHIERLNIPVMTSFLGKGGFDESHQLSLGTVSRHIKDSLKDLLNEADACIVVGYDFAEGISPSIFSNKRTIYIDALPASRERVLRPDASVVGDVSSSLSAFLKELRRLGYRSKWNVRDIVSVRRSRYQQIIDAQDMDSFPFNPFYVVRQLQDVLKGDEHVVSDVGNHKQAIGLGFTAKKQVKVHFSNGLSSMGFALPFAAGLRFAVGADKQIIVVCGDGGFLMNVQELETIKRFNLNIKIVVFVDNAFGMIKSNLLAKYKRVKNLDFSNPDFEQLSRSFGIGYIPVAKGDSVKAAFSRLLRSKRTTLMTIPVKY